MIAVLFLLVEQLPVCAEESGAPLAGRQTMENVGELRLVYGNGSLDDSDALVLFLMAEGFTEDHFWDDGRKRSLGLS